MRGAIPPLPQYTFMAWCLFKHRENFTLNEICMQILSDSSVGIALGYGLDDRGFRVRFPAGAGNFFLHLRVQNGSGPHSDSYPMGNRGSFPEGKAAGA
jgi:hypothetical protein